MENFILEMKKIVDESKDDNLSNDSIRNRLKEYLHYFVLDFIYNSEFKDLIFYGGSCLRILYDLPRMSEDLDFETDKNIDFKKLVLALKRHFTKNLNLKEKFSAKKDTGINRIFLILPIMKELGLSSLGSETLRIKIEIRPVSAGYLKNIKPIFTPKFKYGKSFVIKHYDLSTLFASKLAAILSRPEKGFAVGKAEEKINFKGRDLFDLNWYMEKGILPNEEMLKANGLKESIGEIFDRISVFISGTELKMGLKKDLEPLFISKSFVNNFVNNFRSRFQRLKDERYTARKIKKLTKVSVNEEDYHTDVYSIRFDFVCEDNSRVIFIFKLSYDFMHYAKLNLNNISYDEEVDFRVSIDKKTEEVVKKYIALFLDKIDDYLKRHNNEVYFNRWESKFIKITDANFNPEKEIIFSSGEELINNKKITLEILVL